MQSMLLLQALSLVAVANAVPVLARRTLGDRFAWPLDGGIRFIDGEPLLGSSKTFRGVALAILATAACAPVIGLDWWAGALVGASAMAGDLLSSFLKRRLRVPASGRAIGLDQIPESLLPLLACRVVLPLTALDVVLGVVVFFVCEVLLSRWLFRVGLRERPY